jgi:superfamily II RNA helicase
MEYKGLILDKFQEDSIKIIDKGNSVVVSAPTGSGKTLIADYIIDIYLKKKIKVIYTAPIKALSNQKFKDFCKEYGECNVGLLTGDVVINPSAVVLIMTTEIYRNMALSNDELLDDVKYVIFDEIHYINDVERGYVWEESIIFSKEHIRFLCLSATIPNAVEFADWIGSIKKHEIEVVSHDVRYVPLECKFYDNELGITTLEDIKKNKNELVFYKDRRGKRRILKDKLGIPDHRDLIKLIKNDKLPCFFFNFSRFSCQECAKELANSKIFEVDNSISAFVRGKLNNVSPEIKDLESTKLLRKCLPYGIAFHHAGLIPIMKEIVEELFSRGLIKVLYTTETFAVGINMPAKTVCFKSLFKYDGVSFRMLNSKEYFQIAGRAGRRGIDSIGYSYAMIDRRDFDYDKLKKVTFKDVDPIKSQFRLSINTVLNLIDQHEQDNIDKILCMNFASYQKYGPKGHLIRKNVIFSRFGNIKKTLLNMQYVDDLNKLTEKGRFASRIYSDEIFISEIFGTDVYRRMNKYQILLFLALVCFEPREKTEFYESYLTEDFHDLKKILNNVDYVAKDKRIRNLKDMTALIYPIYNGDSIFDVINNTNLLEGDVIRIFRQIIDKIGQIIDAGKFVDLMDLMKDCREIVVKSMKDIDVL